MSELDISNDINESNESNNLNNLTELNDINESNESNNLNVSNDINDTELLNKTCAICYNDLIQKNNCITNCSHQFCKSCLDQWFNKGELSCPLCRSDIEYFSHQNKNIRIVCITKPAILTNTNTNTNNRIILYRNVVYFWGIFTFSTVLSTGLSIYYICINM